ncbi:MAG: sulfite exporter TauE/SafE family protein [Ginsengibacter sp.]
MSDIISTEYFIYIIIFLAGTIAYVISTLSGGGGSLLLVPIVNFLISAKATAPVLNLGNLIGQPVRIILFWKHIYWKVTLYYVPPAIVGAVLSAWIFSHLRIEWLQLIVGLFLISSIFQYRFGKKERSFKMSLNGFIPLGFIVSFFSTLIGATGPVLNPFYLNYGLEKEAMIATKTVNSFFIRLVQIGSYTILGSLHDDLWLYGIILGAGASLGNWVGKKFLRKVSGKTFRVFVLVVMAISGLLMIVKQLLFFGGSMEN